ncbi:homeobox protein ceh-43-like [Symsagittifera roscoffensis]|uniref:homeobox protein ceh-43-like n=1 Tax=Symsagittifera roscoffensis TaxID=84072 RepID=UPI00307C92B1
MTASEFSVPALTNQQQLQSTCAFTGADGTPNFSQVVNQTQQTQGHIASDFGQAQAVASKTDINGYLHGQQNEAPSQTNYNQFCSLPSNDFLGNTSKLGMQFQAQQYFNQQFPNYPHTQQMYMNMSHPFYNNNQQSNGCQYINNNEKVREDEADGGKSKRIRTLYTKFQTRVLEYYFAQNQYIGLPQRAAIAAQLQLSQTQIKIWFQNKRAKIRRNERGFVLQPNPQSGQITESAQSESPQQENDVNSDAHEMNKENVNILDALSRERDLADVYEQNENERQQQESNVNDHSLSCQTGFENRNCGSEPRTAVLAQCDNLQMINPQQQSMLICESE